MIKRVIASELNRFTEQEVFDYISKHLLMQNKKSICSEGLCAYRGEGGLSCAAGSIIDFYDPNMEGNSWGAVGLMKDYHPIHDDIIGKLQVIHDYIPEKLWMESLIELAEERNLRIDIFSLSF